MFAYTILLVLGSSFALKSVRGEHQTTEKTLPRHHQPPLLANVCAIIEANIRENTRKLKLDDFSWAIFSGTKGRLQAFQNVRLQNQNTRAVWKDDDRELNASFEFTVPAVRAVWEKSSCLGYGCAMTIELQSAVFVLKMKFDAKECVVDHLAFLKAYENAAASSQVDSSRNMSTISQSVLDATVKLLSRVLVTKPFEKIVKDNVNHALLQLPLFKSDDIKWLCSVYRANNM